MKLICGFVFAYADCLFSDAAAHMIKVNILVGDVSSEPLLTALHYLSQCCLSTLKAFEYMLIAYQNIKTTWIS